MLLNFRKVFVKNLFGINFFYPYHSDCLYSGHGLVKETFDDTKMVNISQDWTKMFPFIKYEARREKV